VQGEGTAKLILTFPSCTGYGPGKREINGADKFVEFHYIGKGGGLGGRTGDKEKTRRNCGNKKGLVGAESRDK
jgi:hypothetical protein